jgi:hypothetical protein
VFLLAKSTSSQCKVLIPTCFFGLYDLDVPLILSALIYKTTFLKKCNLPLSSKALSHVV